MKLKKRVLQLGAFSVIALLTACSGNQKKVYDHNAMDMKSEVMAEQHHNDDTTGTHIQHNMLAKNFAHKNIVILEEVYPVNKQTQAELEEVIDAYLIMKDALVKGDVAAADKAIGLMESKMNAVKPDKLEGEGLDAWKDHISLYKDKLKEMHHVKGLEGKRSYFSHISEIMYCTIKSFGLKEGGLFAIYCPMAFDGKGAYWIAESKTIQNPYFGDKMPTCGEIKEEL